MRLKPVLLSAFVAGTVLGHAVWAHAQSPKSPGGTAVPKTADQAYKNIQVLKDAPSDQLIPAMPIHDGLPGGAMRFLSFGECV